ncbi:MAG: LicD family protein [Thermoguttaceae bacterium]|nr:LicD family protein [Thermoguttaceae bacterium]
MNDEIIKKVHDINYKVLRVFDEFCKANEIPYFLEGGTLLGAVRHQDFIPWDDDLDVVVFACDFPRLKSTLIEQLPPEYEFIEYTSHNGYFYDFINRISVKGSRLKKLEPDNPYSNANSLGIDIFVLESVPNNAVVRSLRFAVRKLVYAFAMGHRWKLNYKNKTSLERIVLSVLSSVGWFIPLKWLFQFQEYFINAKLSDDKTYLSAVNYTFPNLSCTFKKEWYSSSCNVQIRDLMLPAPVGYDSVLKTIYGDYMQFPPEEKRVPQHIQDETLLPE